MSMVLRYQYPAVDPGLPASLGKLDIGRDSSLFQCSKLRFILTFRLQTKHPAAQEGVAEDRPGSARRRVSRAGNAETETAGLKPRGNFPL